MSIAQRSAVTTWEGSLVTGGGSILGDSGALSGDVPWAARTGALDGKTSPEELAATAHSSCSAMALVLRLGEGRAVPGGCGARQP